MDAFLTGSRAYGTPKPESDIDLVVYMSEELLELLEAFADSNEGSGKENKKTPPKGSLRFGQLNLICLTDINEHTIWKSVTNKLKMWRDWHNAGNWPAVTRDIAVREFSESLNHYKEHGTLGFEGYYDKYKHLYKVPEIPVEAPLQEVRRSGRKVIKGHSNERVV